ncbi:MAG: hypothetical protein HKN49_12565 [Gammaproteobacteria bacterium]|nr:hypothetical protein [Gammaproteobacteria bacterium]
MGRPRIIDVDYYSFKKQLQRAIDAGGRLEPTDKQEWRAFMNENKSSDVTMRAWARQKFAYGAPVMVVLKYDNEEWDGFYAFSDADEAVLKWVRDPD